MYLWILAQTAFTTKKDYGREEREAQWATAQRTLHGLQPPEAATNTLFNDKSSYRELSEIAEQAKRRAEIARLRELNTLKGHVESVVKLKGLDIDTIQQNYTVWEPPAAIDVDEKNLWRPTPPYCDGVISDYYRQKNFPVMNWKQKNRVADLTEQP